MEGQSVPRELVEEECSRNEDRHENYNYSGGRMHTSTPGRIDPLAPELLQGEKLRSWMDKQSSDDKGKGASCEVH